MSRHARLVLALSVALILLAAWARFDRIGAQSLWNDEGNSYGQSLRTAPDIAINAAADIHPPGYYWLLGGWRVLAGDSEFALRALSAFASILGAAVTFALAKRLYGDAAGVTALAVVAVNTFSVMYAQEARMYALLALCGAASTWALIDAIKSPSRRAVILLAASTAAGLYTNYAYAGVLAMQAVFGLVWLAWALKSRRVVLPVIRTAALGYGAALLLYLPWLPTAFRQVTQWGSTGEPIPSGEAISVILGWLITGPTAPLTGISVSAILLLALGLYHLRAPLRSERTMRREKRQRGTALTVVAVDGGFAPRKITAIPRALGLILPPLWIAVTLGGFLVLGLFREANLKFLLPAQIAAAIWMGRGAWVLWHLPLKHTRRQTKYITRATVVLMVIVLVLAGMRGVDTLKSAPQFQRDDYRGIALAIAADNQPDAAVILNAPGQLEVFGYYARRYGETWTLAPLPVGLTVDEAATRSELDSLLAAHKRIYAVLWGTDERDPQRIVEGVLNTRAYPIDETWYGSVRLARYVTPTEPGEAVISGAQFAYSGGVIELVDFALSTDAPAVGESLEISLNWRADTALAENYKVTVQLLTADGTLIIQRDAEPVGYRRPTSTWLPDEIINDRHALVIPNGLPLAQYRLIVGIYNRENSSERLPVGGQDALILAEFMMKDNAK